MPQLNVYIPEDLAEAVQRHRDGLNLSQVCARALRQEVQKMEAATNPQLSQLPEGVNVPRVVARLRDEQQRRSTAFRDGAADAARWLEEEATIEEIRRFAEWVPAEHILMTPIFSEGGLGARLQGKNAPPRRMLKSEWFRERGEKVKAAGVTGPDEHGYWVAYFKGWQQTVGATWEHVRDEVE